MKWAAVTVLLWFSAYAANPPLGFPNYTAASVVDAADGLPALSPDSIASVYGLYLANETVKLSESDVVGGSLPSALGGTDVTVLVGGIPAGLFYVSPTQINFLIPSTVTAGETTFVVVSQGRAGPEVKLNLTETGSALFLLDLTTVVATHADGTLVCDTAPAHPGEVIVLYAEGLGQTDPKMSSGQIPTRAARIVEAADFEVLLDGVPTPQGSVLYAGVAPGYAGLYQVNVRLPATTGTDPEIRIGIGQDISMAGVHLPVRP